MATDLKAPASSQRQSPNRNGNVAKFALIGAALAAVVGIFAYLGGWFSPRELTPSRFVDGFEHVNGVYPGFRRNHAKGLGVSGFFDSNGNGVRLSKAGVFRVGRVPVIGRFSLGDGHPYVADAPDIVRGLGLEFSPPDGEPWRTAMINLPLFPFNTPQAFYDQMIASKLDTNTGKPDPAKMAAFMESHPETVQALKVIKSKPFSSGFADSTFNSINTFRFVNAAGESIPVRWELTPLQTFEAASTGSATQDKNYLFDAVIAHVHQQPLRWRLVVTIGQAGDPTREPNLAWPEDREKVDLGILTLDHVESDETSAATDITFDPLVLPAGIAPSDDPFLTARSAVYSQAFTRRAGEKKQHPAVTPAEVHKGD